jgi:hypothetical protein
VHAHTRTDAVADHLEHLGCSREASDERLTQGRDGGIGDADTDAQSSASMSTPSRWGVPSIVTLRATTSTA